MVRAGHIGTLRTINTVFSYFSEDPADICNNAAMGGGGLMDIGCYPISVSRFLFAAEPRRALGLVEYDPRFGTDRLASGILDFGGRGTATFTCSTQLVAAQRVEIFGTTGRLEIEIPFNAPNDRPCRLFFDRGTGTALETITVPRVDQYGLECELFSLAIRNDEPVPTPIEDAVRNMEVIEALLRSHRDGRWCQVVAEN